MFLAGVNFTLIWFAWEKQWGKIIGDEEGKYYVVNFNSHSIHCSFTYLQGESLDRNLPFIVHSRCHRNVNWVFINGLYAMACYGSYRLVFTDDYRWFCWFNSRWFESNACYTRCENSLEEIGRIVQPKRILRIRMNGEVIERDRLSLVVGMLFVWTGLFAISCVLLAMTLPNSDFESVISVVAASLGNTGSALGDYEAANTWASMGTPSLLITSVLMWFGRLELMTALLLIHPRTWTREEREAPDRASVKLIRELFEKMEEKIEEKETD